MCGEEKPLTAFHICRSAKSGRYSYCKECTSKKRKKAGQNIPKDLEDSPFYGIEPRVIINEIKQRVNYLRALGWKYEGHMEYTKTYKVEI